MVYAVIGSAYDGRTRDCCVHLVVVKHKLF